MRDRDSLLHLHVDLLDERASSTPTPVEPGDHDRDGENRDDRDGGDGEEEVHRGDGSKITETDQFDHPHGVSATVDLRL